ncbi:MAG: helix-turn-helix transcriptional regulator [Alphaproteobacteria bacterium]|nr:helix-turn-helix transcriptional regulator [Alphaproteobacteria bacterium]
MPQLKTVQTLKREPKPGEIKHLPAKDDGKIIADGGEIKRLRKELGLSQEALSAESGVALKTIRNLEKEDAHRCRPATINTLSKFFKIEPHQIIQKEKRLDIQLLTSPQEIIEWNMNIAATARIILACTGSRSRDEDYMRQIETTMKNCPELVHYRVMSFPPFKSVFQEHLLRVLEMRDPQSRSHGYKTLHIGINRDLVKQPEHAICANETKAIVVLPSLSGVVGEYNTAVLIKNASVAKGLIAMVKNLYQSGQPVETPEDVLNLGMVEKGYVYD